MSLLAPSADVPVRLEIAFADCRYVVTGLTGFQSQQLSSHFAKELAPQSSAQAVPIEVRYRPDGAFASRPPGPTEYAVALEHAETELRLSGIGFAATIERSSLRTTMITNLDNAWFPGGFENVLRVITSYRLFFRGALVLHSAAFVHGDKGFLFCGRSGAGKSTQCRLADRIGLQVQSDELNAVVPQHNGSYWLQAMPFAGDFGMAPSDSAPAKLSGLFGIEKDKQTSLGACSRAEAVSRLIAACPYINGDPSLAETLAERAEQIVRDLPFRILSFTKDTSFWNVLSHEYCDERATLPT